MKSSTEKSICVVNLCNYLIATYPEVSLVVLLTYVFLSSSIPFICENILFVQQFRSKTAIGSIEDYYIAQMSSAIDLIKNLEINNSFLTIPQFQFENYCLEYEKKQLTSLFLTDKSINEIDNKDKDKNKIVNQKVDNAIIGLINKIFFVGYNNSNSYQKDVNEENNTNSNCILNTNENEALINIPVNQLQRYYKMEFKEMSYKTIEQLYKEFKILLKIIESSKKE